MNAYNNKYSIVASTIKPNPMSVKYWADLSSNPNGGDLKYFNGKDWVQVNNSIVGDATKLQKEIEVLLSNKIDKTEDKGLSSNDYTTEEKTKLASLSNYNDTNVRKLIADLALRISVLETKTATLEASIAQWN